MTPRSPERSETRVVADMWWQSWHDAHADIVPRELISLRTRESFFNRIQDKMDIVRVVGSIGEPVGMCFVAGEQMKQLFVSELARGTGASTSLLQDAERILKISGVKTAWLSCAVGNVRAERFYIKCGWSRVGKMIEDLETQNGIFKLETWRFEKEVSSL